MKRRIILVLVVLMVIAALGFTFRRRLRFWRKTPRDVARMVRSEETLLLLTPSLRQLNEAVMNLKLPGTAADRLFDEQVLLVDVSAEPPQLVSTHEQLHLNVQRYHVAPDEQAVDRDDISLWTPVLGQMSRFENAKFKFVRGDFTGKGPREWTSYLKFTGLARKQNGHWVAVKSYQHVTWENQSEGQKAKPKLRSAGKRSESAIGSRDADSWRITAWRTEKVELTESPDKLFVDVIDVAIPAAQRELAIRSRHEELALQAIKTGKRPEKDFRFPANGFHPSVCVVDIDEDGYDDLYVTSRWQRNVLFRNQADGSFLECAAKFGLDLKDHHSCSLFADFDNDGDRDLFVGGFLSRSRYLKNENGKFLDATAASISGRDLPGVVTSITAVDYDNDGLLDVYLSTYYRPEERARPHVYDKLLDKDHLRQMRELYKQPEAHNLRNRFGPPNFLLKNVGDGKFVVLEDTPITLYRNTFASAWSDFDNDGDADLYCSNDFAPNNLFRNDGQGVFVDITAESNAADIGFGMGASWGDYDNDGQSDLYVTNMFSKAGIRITAQVENLDERFAYMAHGNSLLKNEGGKFKKVSGLKPPALLVEEVGWSWSGQFADLNNDGFLDVHALSGFFTAPDEVALPIDT